MEFSQNEIFKGLPFIIGTWLFQSQFSLDDVICEAVPHRKFLYLCIVDDREMLPRATLVAAGTRHDDDLHGAV